MANYSTLLEYLSERELCVDAPLQDGWGGHFRLTGREIEATILFADITGFSSRTIDLAPAEMLIYVNRFFTWIYEESLKHRHGIVDKYIGDEIMVVFSNEFGSDDHYVEALEAARMFAERDEWGYTPHIGVSSGRVIIGQVGNINTQHVSVFGRPVIEASRCAANKPGNYSSITTPSTLTTGVKLESIFPSENPGIQWTVNDPTSISIKEDTLTVTSIVKQGIRQIIFELDGEGNLGESITAVDQAKKDLAALLKSGLYKPHN